ncbi:hypothetical protein [Nocardia australiensis]|uniref:hypothetical protein n=1 Tax=Nocardia australiensis TaxID=2887191 RepID=UPI001D134CD9|nr:hypothetical protein [Nocardia australiensis]
MNGRSIARAAAAVTSLGIGAVLTFATTAVADPVAPAPVDTGPVAAGLAGLTDTAGSDPTAQAGVAALRQYSDLVNTPELRHKAGTFIPFAYAAPTFGCGSNGPITTIIAAATTNGPTRDEGANPDPGTLRFSASPAHSGAPLASGLTVAWININTGASGFDQLDDRTEVGLPTLSKTVKSGPGLVLASMWGIIDYPFAHCVMTPTVGTFSVPNAPTPTPTPDAPASAPPAPTETPGGPQQAPGGSPAPEATAAPATPAPPA